MWGTWGLDLVNALQPEEIRRQSRTQERTEHMNMAAFPGILPRLPKTIGIVGNGTVGHATARAFIEHADGVRLYDIDPMKSSYSLGEVLKCDLVFVCLPTPQRTDGQGCDTSIIQSFFSQIRPGNGRPEDVNLVLRSTVPIGFTKTAAHKYRLSNLVHSPEFLTARCAVTDAQIPARNIVGYSDGRSGQGLAPSGPNSCCNMLLRFYEHRFPGVPAIRMSSDESEAVKLFLNGFFAVKVSYFNEINELADKLGLDWDTVLGGMMSDGRIAHSHTLVPGPDGEYGFGGACLPKDLNNLIQCLGEAGVPAYVTSSSQERNRKDRERE